jgi:hypothetical protein
VGIYGTSLGDTDMMWWEHLLEWLKAKKVRRLVLYVHTQGKSNPSAQEQIRQTNSWRRRFLHQAGADEATGRMVTNQILVIFGSRIFDLENIQIKD